MKSTFKLFFIALFVIVTSSFGTTIYAQGITDNLQTVVTDTVKRTAREQTEKAISGATQKSIDTVANIGNTADAKYADNAIAELRAKSPFFHDYVFLPIDKLRTKQISVWERMIADQEIDNGKNIPQPIKTVAQKLDTTRSAVPQVGTVTATNDDDKVIGDSNAINDAVAGMSVSPEKVLGNVYTIFLKLLLVIFKSRVLFYGLGVLIIVWIITKIIRMRNAE
jgi:hypothetical protein